MNITQVFEELGLSIARVSDTDGRLASGLLPGTIVRVEDVTWMLPSGFAILKGSDRSILVVRRPTSSVRW
jgi:hypothetical protein